MDYLELHIQVSPRNPWCDITVAELADLGFESFVDSKEGVKAYAPADTCNLEEVIAQLSIQDSDADWKHESQVIKDQNWNATWESDFEPVEVEDKLTIVAPFHDKTNAKGMVIEIMPQMSFGTGHHQTTWLMSKALLEMESIPSPSLDMGTGTGVLAILAEKLGAKDIDAIDIEDWAYDNALENVERNKCSEINVMLGGEEKIPEKGYLLILANINKNILKAQMATYASRLLSGGKLLLSGFFDSDSEELVTISASHGFTLENKRVKETWCVLELIKK